MSESLKAVDEKRGREILIRLRDMLAQGVQPTVRVLGLSEAEARWMGNAGLVSITDSSPWASRPDGPTVPFEDRYIVVGIPDTGQIYLIDSGISPTSVHEVRVVPPQVSKLSKIFQVLGVGLWDLVKIALGIPVGIIIGWYLKKHFP